MLKKITIIVLSIFFINIYSQSLGHSVKLQGNLKQLQKFYNDLKQCKNKKVRIAHFGDSILQGDVLTEYTRDFLQSKYGGKGIGFVDVFSTANKMRKSIVHDYYGDWEHFAINSRNPNKIPVGISGSVVKPKKNAKVLFRKSDYLKNSASFSTVKFYYGLGNSSAKLIYQFNDLPKKSVLLNKTDVVNEISLKANNADKLKLEFENAADVLAYGCSFEKNSGVYVDNFPVSGNSGVSLLNIPDKVLKMFAKYFDYSLIILNYGVNVSTPNPASFKVYEHKMVKVIKYLKKYFPNAGIILVSVADKTVRRNGKFVTDVNIPRLLKTQMKIAKRAKVAFWNLFEAMGGKNSMNKWVNHAPPFALKDYTHFTHAGGKRVAELFVEALLKQKK